MEWNPETKAFDEPPHLLFSASAAVRTLTYHTRTIKAVCTAVCSDVRLLEKTTVHPRAWLEGLWHINVDDRTRTAQLRECRERALVAGRANFAAEMYSRLETRGGGGEPVVKCPATWPKKRVAGAEHLFENYQDGAWEGGDHSLAWRTCAPGPRSRSMASRLSTTSTSPPSVERLSWALSVALCSIPGR